MSSEYDLIAFHPVITFVKIYRVATCRLVPCISTHSIQRCDVETFDAFLAVHHFFLRGQKSILVLKLLLLNGFTS